MILAPSGHVAMSGDMFGCHNWGLKGALGTWWVETRDTAQNPTMHRAAPLQRIIQPKMSTVPRLRNCGTSFRWNTTQ